MTDLPNPEVKRIVDATIAAINESPGDWTALEAVRAGIAAVKRCTADPDDLTYAIDRLSDHARDVRGLDTDDVQAALADGIRRSREARAERQSETKPNGKAKDAPSLAFVLYDDLETTIIKSWVVERLLGTGECSGFYSPPGSGKSVLVQDIGLHVAAGLTWCGRKITKGTTLYVALERRDLVKRRAVAFRTKRGLKGIPFAVTGGMVNFRDDKAASLISETIRQVETATRQKTALIIIDTVSRALAGGDENSSKDMGQFVATLGRIHELHPDAHIIVVHHVPQDGDRLRGHGALLGALDTTISVIKLDTCRTATVIKANDSVEGEQISFTLESVTIGRDQDGHPTTAPIVVPITADPKDTPAAKSSKKPNPKKPSKAARTFLDAFTEALNAEAIDIRVMNDGPAVKATDLQAVKRQFTRRYVTGEADPQKRADAARSAFNRTIKGLPPEFATEVRNDIELIWKVAST
jgi:hypothetical protein